jgi:hypothetical protein
MLCPWVPKPAAPSFQAESLKSGLNQSAAGSANVYRHATVRWKALPARSENC